MRKLSADHRGALELLAGTADGLTEAMLLVHGFAGDLLADLILDGYAAATIEHMRAGAQAVEVRRLRITNTGRAALK